ncbi:MAG: efflux RND transporter periplasmic adaptor subunit [Alphaproteobacteria bacterium]|nr:efflux RND transporter periplasmic adaptor subunit [Alphaproteobacteria bacterium SS10]
MQNRSQLITGVAVGALIAGFAMTAADRVNWSALVGSSANASAPATAAVQAPQVQVATAETQEIAQWDEYTGRFHAVDEVDIRARVSGYLEEIHFTPGDVVEQGDLLFTIDPRPFEAALKQAEAAVTEARAAQRLARSELERARRLVGQGHVSQSVYDTRQQEADSASASLAAAQAAVEQAALDLGFTQIHAPVTGRISDDAISVGNLVAAGSAAQALTTIVSTNPIHFVFDATEQQFLQYVRGAGADKLRDMAATIPVDVTLIDEAEFAHAGHIDFIDNRLDQGTGTIRGRAVLNNDDGMLTPGMFGRLRLAASQPSDLVLIPDHAIGSDQTRKFVWVVDGDNTVSRRVVTLGGRHQGLRIIETGLFAGERIVTSGLHMVGDGVTIDPIEAPVQLASR